MIRLVFLFSIFFFLVSGKNIIAQDTISWQFYNPLKKKWMNYQTHGSIQEKLIENGELPKPFYGVNEKQFEWVENHQWIIQSDSIFNLSKIIKYIDIQLPIVDTYTEIFWNDSLVLLTENAFRPYVVQVQMNPNSKNVLKAKFTPPILYHEKQFKQEKFHYPAPNDANLVSISNLTRKPQYQFGWDWTARINTIGFLSPVIFKEQRKNEWADFRLHTKVQNNQGQIDYTFRFNAIDENINIVSSLFGKRTLNTSDSVFVWNNKIENPELWWPNGYGKSYLYFDTISIFSKDNQLIETRFLQLGFRYSDLIQEKDEWGTSYVVQINGQSIFCKGANLIPPSVFPNQITNSVWEEQIQVLKQQHLNMVRIWGGGLYPSDYFLKRCDEEGIMVWQDFMFACAMYPADSSYLANVKEELNYQIPRIAAHPSVVLFNGNNEVDVAWKNWGLQKQYQLSSQDSIKIASDYKKLFQECIPSWVSSFTNIPYVHTSPLSNWGATECYNHGSQHYWGVWHGTDLISDFSKNIGRFNSEFGYQSFPEFSTMLEITNEKTWNLDSAAIKLHQKSYVGNGKILAEINKTYPKPENFMDFVYFSQLIQADAMEQAVSAHRLNAPRCMGSIYWQLNDCYPGPTWSSVDYLGNRKILHYRMSRVMESVTLVRQEDESGFNLSFVSDIPQNQIINYSIHAIINRNRKWLYYHLKSDTVQLDFLKSKSVFRRNELNQYFISNSIQGLEVSWEHNGQKYNRTYWLKNEQVQKAEDRDVKLKIVKIDRNNKTILLRLKSKKPIQHFWIYSTLAGMQYSENDITMLPGKREILIQYETLPKLKDFRWIGLE